jgi:superfamily II DNA or RNA helicase
VASASEVRSALAAVVLDAEPAHVSLGGIILRPHQLDAVARLSRLLDSHSGALLADETGTGKTYIALALMPDDAVIVAPAGLRDMWTAALDRTRKRATFVSYEALSRSAPDVPDVSMLVVDEAHHARNPATRRYKALVRLSRGARVLLLTATPVHNRLRDVRSLMRLFLGSRALSMTESRLSEFIVRRDATAAVGVRVPRVVRHEPLRIEANAEVARALAQLTDPVPAADEGSAPSLAPLLLHRLWSSSDAALRSAVRRRLARVRAMIDSVELGTIPSRHELSLWCFEEDSQQLPLAGLFQPDSRRHDLRDIEDRLREHEAGLKRILVASRESKSDSNRAAALLHIRDQHAGAKIVAFSCYTDTIGALWRLLRMHPGACALTAGGARVAGGELSRRQALERFAPRAQGVRAPPAAESIGLLLSTDLLSEGVNLQDASVIVHLDLPWTPARIAQRVGRVARMNSEHDEVHEYSFAPHAMSERVVALERRLREKMRTIEDAGAGAAAHERILEVLRRWRGGHRASGEGGVLAAAIHAPVNAMVVAVRTTAGGQLFASSPNGVADGDPTTVLRVLERCEGPPLEMTSQLLELLERTLSRFDESLRARMALGLDDVAPGVRVAALRRSMRAFHASSMDRRAVLSTGVSSARALATVAGNAGFEEDLSLALSGDRKGEETLRALGRLGTGLASPDKLFEPVAVLMLAQD